MALPAFEWDHTTQCCRAFSLALARLSCSLSNHFRSQTRTMIPADTDNPLTDYDVAMASLLSWTTCTSHLYQHAILVSNTNILSSCFSIRPQQFVCDRQLICLVHPDLLNIYHCLVSHNRKSLLFNQLSHFNWTPLFRMTSCQEMVDLFYSVLIHWLDYNMPIVRKPVNNLSKP